ncbi:MAG: membrane bound O-acyl transferase MBOAT family protein [Candidatus Peregrinibacteria bacterium Gr01-1014_25]|nr:MAG: membrane bound O-acyl transferase MBOAT family protein [Candidatus Peregrinibacteria bacterium Gr01-1014_25]
MLFHSPQFLFVFLPLALLGFFAVGRWGSQALALLWLTCVSLFFYGYWNPAYLWLLGLSIIVNYPLGTILMRRGTGGRALLIVGIAANLALLGYFKYANFFLDAAGTALGAPWTLGTIVLPLGISFFTFEQVAWLVESHQGKIPPTTFLRYCAFITNFPKLIAGPIVRPHEFLPQLQDAHWGRCRAENMSVGVTIFMIGLFKKVVLADTVATLVSPVFAASAAGASVTLLEAWGSLLAYALQIYFDFSGYTDMAIGVARMFGITLPLNFAAPYRSVSIIDFWRRWHMSLSRLVRDYVYIPLGGNRCGTVRQWINVLVTMAIVGLWHGAGWTFIAWGTLHGVFLVINHAWRAARVRMGLANLGTWWSRSLAWMTTFAAVLVAWVFFRSENMPAALRFLGSLAGADGLSLPGMWQARWGDLLSGYGVQFDLQQRLILLPSQWVRGSTWILALLCMALLLPTTQQFLRHFRPAGDARENDVGPGIMGGLTWQPTVRWALGLAALTSVTIVFLMLSQQSEFLYFQF